MAKYLILLLFSFNILSGELEYLDVNENLLQQALLDLNNLSGNKSSTKSFSMHTPELREAAYLFMENNGMRAFVPLFKEIVSKIEQNELKKNLNRRILHLAIRVDPDTSKMKMDRERNFTSQWHDHGDDDRYIFTLTSDPELTTMLKVDGKEIYSGENRIFLMPGPMKHRTPDPKKGKRIQISLSVLAY